MTDIDPATIMTTHVGAHWCSVQSWHETERGQCLPSLLAEALAAEQAKVARVEAVAADQERPFVDGVPDREGEDIAQIIRAALVDQPEQQQADMAGS